MSAFDYIYTQKKECVCLLVCVCVYLCVCVLVCVCVCLLVVHVHVYVCVFYHVCVEGDERVANSPIGGPCSLPSPRSGAVRGLLVLSLLEHDPNVLLIPQEWRNVNGGIVFIKKKSNRGKGEMWH